MEENPLHDLERLCAQGEDPRMERTTRHRVRESIIRAMCGVMCGAEGWVDIDACGKANEALCTDVRDVLTGIPSQDTCGRVCALLDPTHYETRCVPWVQGISRTVKGVVAIDGNTLRRSHDRAQARTCSIW